MQSSSSSSSCSSTSGALDYEDILTYLGKEARLPTIGLPTRWNVSTIASHANEVIKPDSVDKIKFIDSTKGGHSVTHEILEQYKSFYHMAFIYAIKNNIMAIRAEADVVDFAEGKFMTELSIKLRGYNNRLYAEFSDYMPPTQGYCLAGTTCVGSFSEVNKLKTCEMMVIALKLSDSCSTNNNVLTMDSLIELAKTFRPDLKAVEPSEFDSYVFDAKRFTMVNPNFGLFGTPRVSKVHAQPFLTTTNPVTQPTLTSEDRKQPLPSNPQTIFPGFR